jgi:hypothetical protein
MSVFRHQEILLVQTLNRAAFHAGHHHVENDNPRIRLEDAVSVVLWQRGLAVERWGAGQPA